MHSPTQFEKCAYIRNHGHNNMWCGCAPHGGAGPHKCIPLHFQTYLFFMVGTVVSLLALFFSPWRLFHDSGSPLKLPVSSFYDREC